MAINLQYSYPPSHDETKTRSDSQPSADLKGLREYRNDRAIPCAAHIPACPSISGKPAPRARHQAPAPTLLHGVLGVFEWLVQLRVAMLLLSKTLRSYFLSKRRPLNTTNRLTPMSAKTAIHIVA